MVDGDVSALAPAPRQQSRGLITAERCARTLSAPGGIAAPAACPVIPRGQSILGSSFRGERHVGGEMAACPPLQHLSALGGWEEEEREEGRGADRVPPGR